MTLPAVLLAQLRARFPEPKQRLHDAHTIAPFRYYCPGCGEGARAACNSCGWTPSMGELLQFVDMHPHKGF